MRPVSGRAGSGFGGRVRPLLLVVLERRLDGVLGKDGAVDLHGRQLGLVDDVRVLDLRGPPPRAPLQPLGRQAGRGDGAAAPEGLELGVLDEPRLHVHLDLELHDVAALRRPHEPRPPAGGARCPTKPTSSSLGKRWSPKRIEECASSASTPRAEMTYEGSSVAEVQAEPDARAASLLSPLRTDSPSTSEN